MDIYTSFSKKLLDNDFDFVADTVKVWIGTSSYTYSAAHDFFDDLTNQVSGTNYTADGMTLATKSTSSADPSVADADDVTLAQSGAGFANGRNLVIYKDTGTDGTSPLACRFAAGADFGNTNGQLSIQWASTGILRLDAQ